MATHRVSSHQICSLSSLSSLPSLLSLPTLVALSLAAAVSCTNAEPGASRGDGPSAGGKADDPGCSSQEMTIRELTFTCTALCDDEFCQFEDDRAALVAGLKAELGNVAIVPTSAMDAARFAEACPEPDLGPDDTGATFAGWTVELAVLPLPFDVETMDWSLCDGDIASHFAGALARDMASSLFPNLESGSSLGAIERGTTTNERADFTATILDGDGDAYFEYSAQFRQTCAPGGTGGRFL